MIVIWHHREAVNVYKQFSRFSFRLSNLMTSDVVRLMEMIIIGIDINHIVEFKKIVYKSKPIFIIEKYFSLIHTPIKYMI